MVYLPAGYSPTRWAAGLLGRLEAKSIVSTCVQRYGGTSLAAPEPELVRLAARQIARTRDAGHRVAVCVSAMGMQTDDLIAMARTVPTVRTEGERDLLIAAAAEKAVGVLCLALQDLGVPADGFTSAQAVIRIDDRHGNAALRDVSPASVLASLACGHVPVVCSVHSTTPNAEYSFQGRGDSDTSAVALAAALQAQSCELYTDAAGIFTADPALVPDARVLASISYSEMLAMYQAGYPRPTAAAVELALYHRVELHVRSAFAPGSGTRIGRRMRPQTWPAAPRWPLPALPR